MDRSRSEKERIRSYTQPSSPTHSISSSSSSDFEFRISSSPTDNRSSATLRPADDLFYKGQLLPLHHSPRRSMVSKLHLASSSASSSDTSTSASRDSSGISSLSDYYFCNSYRLSSAADSVHELLKRPQDRKPISLTKFSFSRNKEITTKSAEPIASSTKRLRAMAREVFEKYLNKVRPLYEKLSQKQKASGSLVKKHGPLPSSRHARRRGAVSSCPSSIRSSPRHSGLQTRSRFPISTRASNDSSTEELQSAIQGAIAHCKNSMKQSKSDRSNGQ